MLDLRERDFEAFFSAPLYAYGEGSLYVSVMKHDLKKFLTAGINPLFQNDDDFTYFTVHHGGNPVGRIVVHIHHASNKIYNRKHASFGFFDCAPNSEAGIMLLSHAEKWALDRGCTEIAGNFNLTIAQQVGVVTDGYNNPPYVDMMYNPPHIPRLLKENGYEACFPMSTAEGVLSSLDEDRLLGENQKAVLSNKNYEWKSVNRFNLTKRLKDAHLLLNDAFKNNPMFVPLTSEEFKFQTASLADVIDPRISTVVYYKGRPAGALICIPDVNPLLKRIGSRFSLGALYHFWRYKKVCKRAVIIYYAVTQQLHSQGINGAMVYNTIKALKRAGYTHVGGTWIADENKASLRIREKAGIGTLHRLHLFRKELGK